MRPFLTVSFWVISFIANLSGGTLPPPFLQDLSSVEEARQSSVLVAITFHYDSKRFCYLEQVLSFLATFPKVDIVIITNTKEEKKIRQIEESFQKVNGTTPIKGSKSIRSFPTLEHPHNLTWCHKDLISNEFFDQKNGYTHFIYLEDDMGLDFNNFSYFVHFRKEFKNLGVIPSFLRVEVNQNNAFVSTDYTSRVNIDNRFQVHYENYVFVNPKNPYTACFILDHELAQEYVASPSFDRTKSSVLCNWGTRERAAMGLCFVNVPPDFTSRYVIPLVKKSHLIPSYIWIYHLPHNYANDPTTNLGKIKIENLFFSRQKNPSYRKGFILKP
jgi:hypothetical protein